MWPPAAAPATRRANSAALIAFLALAGLGAETLAVGLHEAAGHGLATMLVGGRFLAFFISPIEGRTYLWVPGAPASAAYLASVAAGVIVNAIVGLVAWAVAGSIHSFTVRLFVYMLAMTNLFVAIAYVGAQQLVEATSHALGASGGYGGDIGIIYTQVGVSPVAPSLVVTLGGIAVWALLMRQAPSIVNQHLAPPRPRGAFRAFWRLVLPSAILYALYYAAVFPWLNDYARVTSLTAWPVLLAYSALGAGLLSLWRRARGAAPSTASGAWPPAMSGVWPVAAPERRRPPSNRALLGWSLVLALFLVACPLVFGPTSQTALGVCVQNPSPDGFDSNRLFVRLALTLYPDGVARMAMAMQPVARPQNGLRECMTQRDVAVGPSAAVATGDYQEVAGAVLPQAQASVAGTARRAGDAWIVDGSLSGVRPGALTIVLPAWTLSAVARIDVSGPGLRVVEAQPAGAVATSRDHVTWTGSPDSPQLMTLRLTWGT